MGKKAIKKSDRNWAKRQRALAVRKLRRTRISRDA